MRKLLIYILLFFASPLSAQVIIQFVPEVSGRTVDGLFQVKIINPNRAQNAVLTITVTERSQGTVCIVKTPSFSLIQGTNSLPVSASRGATVQFGGSSIGRLTGLNKQFAQGDYDYCFSIKLAQSDLPDEQCFSYLLAPFSDLGLTEPAADDKICNTKPLFSWQPLIPGIAGSYYQLVLVEVKTEQSAIEAMQYNFPVINQRSIVPPLLPYPAVARELVKGKKYAWQVSVYKDQTVLNRSEIWSFTVDCQEEAAVSQNDNGYRDIEDILKGDYYVAVGVLKFSLINPYAAATLNYEITSLDKPDKKIKRLPKVAIVTGKNKVLIDLSERSDFEDKHYYVIRVHLPSGAVRSLRFLYAEIK